MRRIPLGLILGLAATAVALPVAAAEIRATVSGLDTADGEVGCALHRDPGPFPLGSISAAHAR